MSLSRLRSALILGLVALALPGLSAAADLALPATPETVAAIVTEKGATVSLDTSADAPALKVTLPAGGGYPGINFPLGAPTLDLSAFNGIELEVSNISQTRVRLHLRVDNPGDWQKSPWNTERAMLAPGETKTIRLFFCRSGGQAGYALDPAKISGIKLFADAPKPDAATLLIKRLTPFVGAPPAAVAPPPPRALPDLPETNSEFSPPISGELIDLAAPDALARLKFNHSTATVADEKLRVVFSAAGGYPNFHLPVPQGGWDLSPFAGVEVTVHNPGPEAVSAYLRVDNPPNARARAAEQNPWNTERLNVKPGDTQVLRLAFGLNNGAPGYEPHAGRISSIQVFLNKPKQDTTLVFSDIKAWGSASDRAVNAALTQASDRTIPVIPPDWLGQRPPVEGDWVKTLDETFAGSALDKKIWSTGFPWDGLQPGQLQRYAPENVVIADGAAHFIAEKRPGHHNDDPTKPRREYTSGLIQTYDKWTQLYGYLEARIKLPTTRGLWPAFWTMPDRGAASGLNMWQRRSTSNGAMEIDIMEHLCEWGPGRHNAAVHWDDYGANHKAWGTAVFYGPTPDGWHTFGLLWEPGKLVWYLDGKKVAEYENERVATVPAYVKLNIQIGGWATKDVDDASLPDRMSVDYVRVWQLRERLAR